MGHKVNPIGLRLGINRTWDSRWYADGDEYGRLLHEDAKIRAYLQADAETGRRLQDRHRAARTRSAGSPFTRHGRVL